MRHASIHLPQGQPFAIGRETQLEQSSLGGDPIPAVYPAAALSVPGSFVFLGVRVLSQPHTWGSACASKALAGSSGTAGKERGMEAHLAGKASASPASSRGRASRRAQVAW